MKRNLILFFALAALILLIFSAFLPSLFHVQARSKAGSDGRQVLNSNEFGPAGGFLHSGPGSSAEKRI